MKRDMDLARKILLAVEATAHYADAVDQRFEGYTDEQVSYNVMLLCEAGLIEAQNASAGPNLVWRPERLTWEGHEFLDAARNNNIWKRAKEILAEAGTSGWTILLQVLVELGKAEVMKYLK